MGEMTTPRLSVRGGQGIEAGEFWGRGMVRWSTSRLMARNCHEEHEKTQRDQWDMSRRRLATDWYPALDRLQFLQTYPTLRLDSAPMRTGLKGLPLPLSFLQFSK